MRAPLLSLSATGVIGGHRRGRSRRITVDEEELEMPWGVWRLASHDNPAAPWTSVPGAAEYRSDRRLSHAVPVVEQELDQFRISCIALAVGGGSIFLQMAKYATPAVPIGPGDEIEILGGLLRLYDTGWLDILVDVDADDWPMVAHRPEQANTFIMASHIDTQWRRKP